MSRTVEIQYYALLREQRGMSVESTETGAETPEALYAELRERHGFTLAHENLKVVVNEEFVDWLHPLNDGDTVVFIPPVAGG